jgi:hypothetical protein
VQYLEKEPSKYKMDNMKPVWFMALGERAISIGWKEVSVAIKCFKPNLRIN